MRMFVRHAFIGVLVLCSFFGPALAADLITLQSSVTFPTANQGGADEGCCFVSNNTGADVKVSLGARVVFSDGKVQRLSGIGDPGVLGPGGAYEVCIFFIVPADAALGTAQFVCSASARQGNQRESETSTSTFDVVP